MTVKFGPAGSSDSFRRRHKSSMEMPAYLHQIGLDAFEYQCGRGVRISQESAGQLGRLAREEGVALSLHAPYYISLSSTEPEKREKSIDYMMQSARAAAAMGADRVVVHTGSCAKISREEALALAMDTMRRALRAQEEQGLAQIRFCPEVMGKINQLGTLEEVLALCRLEERLIPCVDFGHLNARTLGALKTPEDFKAAFDAIENALGIDRLRELHIHFSKIAYTAGGEKEHLTFADREYGPDFEPLMELLARKGCHGRVICESAGTQTEDALAMRQEYYRCLAETAQQEMEETR